MRAILALPIFLAAASPAADLSLRLGLTVMPKDTEFTVDATGPGGSYSETSSDSWDSAGRLTLGLYGKGSQPLALYLGGGLAISGYDARDGAYEADLSQVGIFVEPGVSFQVNDKFCIEAGVILGAGGASYHEQDTGYTLDADGGAYGEIGLVIRPVVTLDKLLLLAELGYVTNSTEFDKTDVDGLPGVQIGGEVTTSGAFFSLGIGMKFN